MPDQTQCLKAVILWPVEGGHADLSILHLYLAQTEVDLKAAHEKSGPVNNFH